MTDMNRLLQDARNAQKLAVAPYSDFSVGAALLSCRGQIYTGCNIEVRAYGLTICAERVAIFKAISEGELQFQSLVVVLIPATFVLLAEPAGRSFLNLPPI